MSHIEGQSLRREVHRATKAALIMSTAAAVFSSSAAGFEKDSAIGNHEKLAAVAPTVDKSINGYRRPDVPRRAERDDGLRKRPLHPLMIEKKLAEKPEKTLEQKALEFIMPDPADARDARTKSASLGDMVDHVYGPVFTKRQPHNVYETTWFGGYEDPEDNGLMKYEDQVRRVLSKQSQSWKDALKGKSGKEFEAAIKYFSAGAGPKGKAQFEVGQKIKLTSPTGEVVIVVAGDEGPDKDVQDGGARLDMSKPALDALGEPEKVKAEEIPDHLEKFIGLGPVNKDKLLKKQAKMKKPTILVR